MDDTAELKTEINKLRSDDIDPRFAEQARKIADSLDAILDEAAAEGKGKAASQE